MKPYGLCEACQQVRPLNAHLMGLCDNCEKIYARDTEQVCAEREEKRVQDEKEWLYVERHE